jgi:hypothetical protein
MVKSVLGVNHQGLQDWLIQRVSAVVMAIYSIAMVAYFLFSSPLDFVNWHALFAHVWMKVATLLFVASFLFHVDYLYRLRETVLADDCFKCSCFHFISGLLLLGAIDSLGCIINEFTDADI